MSVFFFSSRRRHTRLQGDWSSDVCSSDLSNLTWRVYRQALINENKQRAARFGIDGNLIDFSKKTEVPFDVLLDELLEFVDDVVDELGSRKDVYYAREILRHRPGADRQLKVYEETKDLKAVVD